MKPRYYLLLSLFIFSFSCNKEDDFYKDVVIETDKEKYSTKENVLIKVSNNYADEISYYKCSSYDGIPPSVLKYSNNEWTGFWGPICNGYSSWCCNGLDAKEIYLDTLNLNFEKGIYRIEYSFIIKHGEGYHSFYSNEFQIE
ncbi:MULTISPECIES: hypothetical protein [Maribellus]|uniref:Lipoprotein n=1 Tax=Maribellus comscasis TaxID=2681766 RepID=A0A6I6JZV8_9BACT|nr:MULTISPECIES: hypothetical protein [Maribellus]MCG6189416.1 hypothetical protein [Maribellus maritimus]QGY46720.1 hypothetical protein GM418_24600 [Maribellus comscasis]